MENFISYKFFISSLSCFHLHIPYLIKIAFIGMTLTKCRTSFLLIFLFLSSKRPNVRFHVMLSCPTPEVSLFLCDNLSVLQKLFALFAFFIFNSSHVTIIEHSFYCILNRVGPDLFFCRIIRHTLPDIRPFLAG